MRKIHIRIYFIDFDCESMQQNWLKTEPASKDNFKLFSIKQY